MGSADWVFSPHYCALLQDFLSKQSFLCQLYSQSWSPALCLQFLIFFSVEVTEASDSVIAADGRGLCAFKIGVGT